MNKKLVAGVMMVSIMLPSLVFAQTDVRSQIESLMSQIRTLQAQLHMLLQEAASSTKATLGVPPGQLSKAMCIRLGRNLRHGMEGEDVRALQEWLLEDKENTFIGRATGFFGPLTARAMARFQTKLGIASTTDGSVGPLTRGFFERQCGKGLSDDDGDKRGKVAGEITAVATSSITVGKGEGKSHVVHITGSTTIKVFASATSTPTTGTMADLTLGKRVAASGTANADGSLTALEIRVGASTPPPFPALKKLQRLLKFDNRGKKVQDKIEESNDDDDEDVDEDDEDEDDD